MAVTLARLRTFVALAETLSFEKASQLIGRSQPAVSEQIKTLEETIGFPLFHRQTRSVSLTFEGELFFRRISRIMLELDTVLQDVRKISTLESGEVRVGATPTLACYILPEIIGSFRKAYPGIHVYFSDETAARLQKMVLDRQLDFYFGAMPSSQSSLHFEFVARDDYVIVAPKNHPLTQATRVHLKDLTRYPLLLLQRGTLVREEIDRFLIKHQLPVQIVEEVSISNHFTLGGLVEAGCGITLLPRSALPVIAHPGTVTVDVPAGDLVRVLGVTTRADYRPSPAAQAFLDAMLPRVRQMLQSTLKPKRREVDVRGATAP